MKVCPKCNSQLADDAMFCTSCGAQLGGSAQEPQSNPQVEQQNQQFNQQTNQQFNQQANQNPYYAQPVYNNPYDHTSEFEKEDIAKNKVFAMAAYLLGTIGIIIALLANRDSDYLRFHIKEAVKIAVIDALVLIGTVALFWTIIVWIIGSVLLIMILVIRIVCFGMVCAGSAKEVPIIRGFKL